MEIYSTPHHHRYYVFLICFIAAIGGFLFGFDTAVISGALPFVVKQFDFDAVMEGWFVSSAIFGCIVGVIISGKLSDKIGRKMVMVISAGLFFLSAVGSMFAMGTYELISYRLIGGIGIGVASMICPLYISETAPAHFRGTMVALYQLAITIGILAAYFSNAYLLKIAQTSHFTGWLQFVLVDNCWRAMIGIGLLPSLLFCTGLVFVPESPRWLIQQNKIGAAKHILQKIDFDNAQNEVNQIQQSVTKHKGILKELFSPSYQRPLLIGLTLPFLSQVSGINAVIYYGPSILDKAGFTLGDAFGGQVTIGIVNVLFTFIAIFKVDKWGRKPLLTWGVLLAFLALLFIGILFSLNYTQGYWILGAILVFIASFAFSFGPVCFIIISEIFPTNIRAEAVSLATLSLWIGNFFVGQLTPIMLKSEALGPSVTFWIFAGMCLPALWLSIKRIPETKGKTLEEIEKYWQTTKI